ncbi:MAG: hypothetical protein GY730_06575 [bacterium]|nr:hypothetical protein [bacterium]
MRRKQDFKSFIYLCILFFNLCFLPELYANQVSPEIQVLLQSSQDHFSQMLPFKAKYRLKSINHQMHRPVEELDETGVIYHKSDYLRVDTGNEIRIIDNIAKKMYRQVKDERQESDYSDKGLFFRLDVAGLWRDYDFSMSYGSEKTAKIKFNHRNEKMKRIRETEVYIIQGALKEQQDQSKIDAKKVREKPGAVNFYITRAENLLIKSEHLYQGQKKTVTRYRYQEKAGRYILSEVRFRYDKVSRVYEFYDYELTSQPDELFEI